jgi:methylase of polypeptide subunit release factors
VNGTSDRLLSYWPTPIDIADDLVYWLLQPWHGQGDGIRVLEPSAGEGHLIRAIQCHLPEAHITAVEPSYVRATTLRTVSGINVVESTLENYLVDITTTALSGLWQPFDLAIMNPPFTLVDQPEAWADHILAIYHDPYLLAPGGTLGAVVPRILITGKSKRVRKVRELFACYEGSCYGGVEECDRGAFDSVGARVSVALMWAQKPFDSSSALVRYDQHSVGGDAA